MHDVLTQFRAALDSAEPRAVSVGYRSLTLFSSPELEAQQVGYSRDQTGRDLAGDTDGAWQHSWLVVGTEDLCGDPIFVDLAGPGFPVYTAMHGEGAWRPTLLALSFESFLQGLREVERLSNRRTNPKDLAARPLSPAEHAGLLDVLACLGADVDRAFWTDWFET